MKVYNLKNVKGFFEVLDKCKGIVELVTTEGDRINLKSKLCQYVAISKMFSDAQINDIEIIAYEPEDVARLFKFLSEGETSNS